ncbi:MAG TPA: RICIN domain-containing protein [Candidatus Saccharimonadales bacterium]|nr:RICIN domain-containing protein [Candidatus Saccharimonadales bacterium]
MRLPVKRPTGLLLSITSVLVGILAFTQPVAAATIPSQVLWDNYQSGECMGVPNNPLTNGSKVYQTSCNAQVDWDNWVFHYHSGTTSYYTIQPLDGGNYCLDVPGASKTAGVQLEQWTCNGQQNQQWMVLWWNFSYGQGYQIWNRNSFLCIDINGTKIVQNPCRLDGNQEPVFNQLWNYIPEN